jgi:hypothetical protein
MRKDNSHYEHNRSTPRIEVSVMNKSKTLESGAHRKVSGSISVTWPLSRLCNAAYDGIVVRSSRPLEAISRQRGV